MLFASHSAEIDHNSFSFFFLLLFFSCFVLINLGPISDQNSPPLVPVVSLGRSSPKLAISQRGDADFGHPYISFFLSSRHSRISSAPPLSSPLLPEEAGRSGIISNNYSSRRARFPVDESAERHGANNASGEYDPS